MRRTGQRRGVAIVYALVVLAILGVLMTVIARQVASARRMLDARQAKLQATWLARSGVELAAARLLSGEPQNETVEIIPGGRVTVRATRDGESFRVECDARYEPGSGAASRITLTRIMRRAGGRVEITSP